MIHRWLFQISIDFKFAESDTVTNINNWKSMWRLYIGKYMFYKLYVWCYTLNDSANICVYANDTVSKHEDSRNVRNVACLFMKSFTMAT